MLTSTRNIVKKVGFTLAEVLIVLGIIGIIAEMTIPTVMHDVQQQVLKTMWKKEYSVLSQVVSQMAQDNGGSIKGLFTSDAVARDMFKQYLGTIKQCDDGGSFGNCWAADYKRLDGGDHNWGDSAGLILKDGASMMFTTNGGFWANCDLAITPTFLVCGYIPVDVNGPLKKPNRIGKDIFSVWILENGILPEGTTQDGRNNCKPNDAGTTCSADYLYN